jgi:wyosine [tRNA(Phe)-imidazoG37] synthetase (radical SAM superfamily)
MAWTQVQWACGHNGAIQLYGKNSQRDARVTSESGRKCMACWLIEQWERDVDPRAQREDRYILAEAIRCAIRKLSGYE